MENGKGLKSLDDFKLDDEEILERYSIYNSRI